jgi:membrane-bound lytic murein transglycosylase B
MHPAFLSAVLSAVLLVSPSAFSQAAEPFSVWLQGVRRDALKQGIPAPVLDVALAGIQPVPRIIELDRKQPEGTITLDRYLSNVINDRRIQRGRELLQVHAGLLQRISAETGVPPQTIVALWAMESGYGENMGSFRVVEALATLAYEGRRAEFFRAELMQALKILTEGHIRAADMKGSWAGAMGQAQFMPSTFLKYAVDGDGDGRRDIWKSVPDVLASSANFLNKLGWKAGETWGREVLLPAGFDSSLLGLDKTRSIEAWRAMGVRRLDGGTLSGGDTEASAIRPTGSDRAFLVQTNFKAVMKWNKSTFFATAVGLLSDQIGAKAESN